MRALVRAGIAAWARNLTEQQLAGLSLSDLETDLMSELGWRPIETAPKAIADPILVANAQRVVRAFWFEQTPRASGWCIALADSGPVWLRWEPTHWQPLPDPPEVSRG